MIKQTPKKKFMFKYTKDTNNRWLGLANYAHVYHSRVVLEYIIYLNIQKEDHVQFPNGSSTPVI